MFQVIQTVLYLRGKLASHGHRLPNTSRLFLFLLFERLSRRARLRASVIPLSSSTKRELGKLFSRAFGLLVLLGHDDPVDRGESSSIDSRFEYLSRAICGYLIASKCPLPAEPGCVQEALRDFESLFSRRFRHSRWVPDLRFDRDHLVRSPFARRLTRLVRPLLVRDLLHDPAGGPETAEQDVQVLAAIELGTTIRALRELLARCGLPARHLAWQSEFIQEAFIRAGYAQAHSIEQEFPREVTWKRYRHLACWKSNAIEDIGATIRGVLNPSDVLSRRFGRNRFCEQIYLDDLHDIGQDSRDRILGAAHVYCIEQGRIADLALRCLDAEDQRVEGATGPVGIAIEESGILDPRFEGAFVHASAFCQSSDALNARCYGITSGASPREIEPLLREALTNTRAENRWPLRRLAERRSEDCRALRLALARSDAREVCRAIHRSGVPLRFATGLLVFIREVRADLRSGFRPGPGGLAYYAFLMTLGLWLSARFRWSRFHHRRARPRGEAWASSVFYAPRGARARELSNSWPQGEKLPGDG